ncbi:hypothetical protein D3C81_2231150 [compost metagenome]
MIHALASQRAGTIGFDSKCNGTLFDTALLFCKQGLFTDEVALVETDKAFKTAFPST